MALIEPVECPNCHQRAFLGDPPLSGGGYSLPSGSSWPPKTETVVCNCGHRFERPYDADQHILGRHDFGRWRAASTHQESITGTIRVGEEVVWKLGAAFDVIGAWFCTPYGAYARLSAKISPGSDEVRVISSGPAAGAVRDPGDALVGQPIEVHVSVYGLRGLATIPTWRQLFYSAMSLSRNGLLKPALIEYATTFEAFLADYLRGSLTARYDATLAKWLLGRPDSIDVRLSRVMQLATGFRFTSSGQPYQEWRVAVREPRNALAHAVSTRVAPAEVEAAHRATYRAIRWIEQEPTRV